MKISLAGNPNSGKTTLFNALTGRLEKVGNWAGVTISKKEAPLRKELAIANGEATIVDLPGAYSMSPFTLEESITRDFIKRENPDVILNVVDATNLNRSLFFTTQLLELGIPVVVALNKSDLNKSRKLTIDVTQLSQQLGCPVVETVAADNSVAGLTELVSKVVASKDQQQVAPFTQEYSEIKQAEEVQAFDAERFSFVKQLVAKVETRQVSSSEQTIHDKVDKVLAHKWFGLPIFAVIMWCVFSISQTHVGPLFADTLVGWIDSFYGMVEGMMGDDVSPLLSALLLDGIIGGVGAVVGFLPLIMVLFFMLALLEDSGYMARVAIIMDRFFKKVGLSGKSIIPMIIGTGCAIPGIMATRTIQNERQRRTTAMLTPFMPCGAKLPVIALFAGVFFQDSAWVGTSMYFAGIGLIILGAMLIVRITGEKSTRSFFILEMPEYRVPSLKLAMNSTLSRAKAFIIKAGTIILLCNAAVQIMQTFTWGFEIVPEGAESTSILAGLASPFAFLLIPLGFGVWQLAAAAITGFIAKENVVGTLAVVYGITNFIDTEELALVSGSADVATVMGLSSVAALAYLMFNLFTPPCFAAIGAMNAELENKKWLMGGIGLQLGIAYVTAFVIYQVGTFATTGALGEGFVFGLIVCAALIGYLFTLLKKGSLKEQEKLGLSLQ
ncbi:ferrous iron transporter B [Vibrio ponticus]|uniref:Ferrous iron transport protein B n=1 Tax=Vibrio ponticus TaxID=265668 RepID=A0ABX3F4F3_9VIBR|nr:ferrous iron transporter B [Vibrio ponticus]OLQ84831.1 ferrous iron transporter B [Vibrio ponticus]